MLKKLGRPPTCGLILLLIILSSLTPASLANIGINWLTAQAQANGHYSTPDDLDIPFITTAETLLKLLMIGALTNE
jgi:hypothetical protein